MYARIAFLVLFALCCVQGGRKNKGKHRAKAYRRFPKPERWMLYSSEYDPVVEENGCFDLYGPRCVLYANNPGYCHYNEEFMKKFCKKSCKWCKDMGDRDPIMGRIQSLTNGGGLKNEKLIQGFLNGDCEDLLDDCSKYIKTPDDCNNHSSLTRKYCARTCGHCCSDRIAECSVFIKRESQCTSLNGFFRKYCPSTCKFCGPPKKPVKTKDNKWGISTEELVGLVTDVIIPHAESTTSPNKPRTTSFQTSTSENTGKTKCQTMQIKAESPLIGAFYPECKENGEFQEKQCWGSTGHCWCVDQEGNEIPGTKVQFKQPNCALAETSTTAQPSTTESIAPSTKVTKQKRQKDVPASPPTKKSKRKTKTTPKTECKDRLNNCAKLIAKNKDYCENYVNYMKEYCRKTCNFCSPTVAIPKCRDKRKRKCKRYAKFQGYCTVYKDYMSEMCPRSCRFCGVAVVNKKIAYKVYNEKYEFAIKTMWDGSPINHDPIKIKLSAEDNLNVRLEVSGPFFDQPGKPPCLAGQPCWRLWEYEVAEVFFLGDKQKYLELEVSPHGPHLLLLLDGVRKPFKTKLPMRYSATIDNIKKTWNGTAIVPIDYFPPNMRKINAYAIHGPDNSKVYQALYPAKGTLHPDFHQLKFFQDFDFKSMFPQAWTAQPMSPFWVDRN